MVNPALHDKVLYFLSANLIFFFPYHSSAVVFVVCCYVFLAGVALSILLIQQLILISFNMTSYEWRCMQDQQSCWKTLTSSPHNKGIVRNWSEFLRM